MLQFLSDWLTTDPSLEASLNRFVGHPGPPGPPHVEQGAAGWVLVSIACRPGDVLVVGAGRRGALARMVSCKVSRYCAARAHCPVILVPPSALAREAGQGRLVWVFWHRTLTPARVLRDQDRPAA